MSEPGLIIVGSGPGGVSAAEAYREHAGSGSVRILTADAEPPYERPPLSKDYLRGSDDTVSMHPTEWYAERSIDVSLEARVDAIDPAGHTVTVGRDTYSYGSLILATGAAPTPLPVPGAHHALQLRSFVDASRLRQRAGDAKTAVVIGAGFIGCEVAASLALCGIRVTLVAPDAVPQEKRLGRAAGERLKGLVTATGVQYLGGVSVRELDDGVVHLNDGDSIECDLIVAATGVAPCGALAGNAGLDVRDGRVMVGADMRASAQDVYAVGDVALAFNEGIGRHIAVEHWQDADDHGAIAGANAAGRPSSWRNVPGFWSTVGDATLKYHAWGDGYERDHLVERDGGFTVWYESAGVAVGVLTHDADDDYDEGGSLIQAGKPAPGDAG